MRTYLTLRNDPGEPLPAGIPGPEIRYPSALVEHFLREFTSAGDVVLDPFAGFGTTLLAAETLDREGWGVEGNVARLEWGQAQLRHPERLLRGDSRKIAEYGLPAVDFCMTSPPYMGRKHTEDPLTDYAAEGSGYAAYLKDLQAIFAQVGRLMKPGGRLVIEVSNLKSDDGGEVTPLAWDIARVIGEVLVFEGEVIVCWEPTYGFGYDHSYCLVFRAG